MIKEGQEMADSEEDDGLSRTGDPAALKCATNLPPCQQRLYISHTCNIAKTAVGNMGTHAQTLPLQPELCFVRTYFEIFLRKKK